MNMNPRTVVLLTIGYMSFTLLHGVLSIDEGGESKKKQIAQNIVMFFKASIFLVIASWYFPIVVEELDNAKDINSMSVLTFVLFVNQFADVLGDFIRVVFKIPTLLTSFKNKGSE